MSYVVCLIKMLEFLVNSNKHHFLRFLVHLKRIRCGYSTEPGCCSNCACRYVGQCHISDLIGYPNIKYVSVVGECYLKKTGQMDIKCRKNDVTCLLEGVVTYNNLQSDDERERGNVLSRALRFSKELLVNFILLLSYCPHPRCLIDPLQHRQEPHRS